MHIKGDPLLIIQLREEPFIHIDYSYERSKEPYLSDW